MTIQYIAVTLGVLLCVALLGIILLCGLACRAMDERLKAEDAAEKAQGEIRLLKHRLARKSFQENRAKEIAASGANTDSEQGK